jgi:hypothetical protein
MLLMGQSVRQSRLAGVSFHTDGEGWLQMKKPFTTTHRASAACLLALTLCVAACQESGGSGNAADTGRADTGRDVDRMGIDRRGQTQWEYTPGSDNPILDRDRY